MCMSLRRTIAFVGCLLFLSSLVWAKDEPWKDKPYGKWDKKDLDRIFTDSPWSRVATVPRSWLPISNKDVHEKIISGASRQLSTEIERSSEGSVGGDLNINVYWASSRVIRAASARKSELVDGKKNVDVDKYALEPQEEYQIVVQSTDMAPFFRHDEKYFQTVATLEMKKSKLKLSPSHIRYERDAQGVLVVAAIFFFPKKTPSGDPVIVPDEKNISFVCKLEDSTLQVSFDPQKMVDSTGTDL
jgi:hypothetical protein